MLGANLGLTGRRGVQAAVSNRAQVLSQLLAVASCTFGYAPRVGDTLTSTSFDSNARVITHDADISARLFAQGLMAKQTYASSGSQSSSAPDTLSLSFGNGVTDLPFSVVALVDVTDTAASRIFAAKWDNGLAQREWQLRVTTTDVLQAVLFQESTDRAPSRASNAPITQGSLRMFGMTYDGRGGATAADGITLYQDWAVIASTAANDASYVAMENTNSPLTIGSLDVATGQFLDGADGLIMIPTVALSAAQMSQYKAIANIGWALAL